MSWDIITIIATAAATLLTAVPIGVWVGARMVRTKYQAEIDDLRADVKKKIADAQNQELENVRKAADILVASIVPPLESQINKLNNEVARLNDVLESIWGCPHIAVCPAKHRLLQPQKGGGGAERGRDGTDGGHGGRKRVPGRGARDDPDGEDRGGDCDRN